MGENLFDVEVVGAGNAHHVAYLDGQRGRAGDVIDHRAVGGVKVGESPADAVEIEARMSTRDEVESTELCYVVAVCAADYGSGL